MQTVFKAITATIKGFVWHYQLKLLLKVGFWASDLELLRKDKIIP